jgi:pimeloyl-ACP methyl ester carboxylesterase
MRIGVNEVELATTGHGDHDGSAPALVLLHGFTGSADDWSGVVGALAEARRVVVVEHRGHGDSTNTGDAASYTFDQLVADFAVVADELALDRFDLLGHSMGGIVAQRYALAHPDRLRSLVLMDTGARPNVEGPGREFMLAGIELARSQGLGAVFEAIAPYLGEGDGAEATRDHMRRNFERMDPQAFIALADELHTYPSMIDDLAGLEVPTTVIVGENDHALRGAADDLAAAIPGAVLVVIPDAAHSPQVENRPAWMEAVEAHLQRVA